MSAKTRDIKSWPFRLHELNTFARSSGLLVTDRTLVLIVGTNNLQTDGANVIVNKYKDLFMEAKKFKYGKVSIVSILHREDT